jgi:small subunit ribosomal protein S2
MNITNDTVQNTTTDAQVEAMAAVGAQFGFVKSRRHPSVEPFIFGIKNKIEIFDLVKTGEELSKAVDFVKTLGSKNGMILFVGGKNEASSAIAMVSESIGQPFVSGRFIGGTLTNFPEIRKRVEKFEDLLVQKEKGELSKYTKKERLLIDREIEKLRTFFSGITPMKRLPQAVFVVDAKREVTAVREAHRIGVPVIALCGTDNNFADVEYPIPANDSSKASIEFFLKRIAEAFEAGKKEIVK